LLTVGDGLAAQIPSLTISVAAGLVVTRVATGEDIGNQIKSQLSKYPQALFLASGITAAIGLMPGMAHFPFLFLGGVLGTAGWRLSHAKAPDQGGEGDVKPGAGKTGATESKMDTLTEVTGVDPLGMMIGFGLAPLVGTGEGRLLNRLTAVRQRYGRAMGFLIPAVHIRDSSDLPPHGYRFTLRGSAIGGGESYPTQWLAIEGPLVTEKLTVGRHVKDPAFGQPAVWIPQQSIPLAEELGYTVVDAPSAIATHFAEVLKKHGAELLGRPQVEGLMTKLAEHTPRLTEDLRTNLSVGIIRQVLQGLLFEEIPIRDFERIAEALVETADGGAKDIEKLLAAVRLRLGRFIVTQTVGNDPTLKTAVLPPRLEELVARSLKAGKDTGTGAEIEADTVSHLRQAAENAAKNMKAKGQRPVLVVQASLRRAVAKAVNGLIPVISLDEIPDSMSMQVVQTAEPAGVHG
jgi:flagellar biosynthesis protein FlhA